MWTIMMRVCFFSFICVGSGLLVQRESLPLLTRATRCGSFAHGSDRHHHDIQPEGGVNEYRTCSRRLSVGKEEIDRIVMLLLCSIFCHRCNKDNLNCIQVPNRGKMSHKALTHKQQCLLVCLLRLLISEFCFPKHR